MQNIRYLQTYKATVMRLLVIDDERSIRNSLQEILADEGYDVDVAEDGAAGCAMAEKEKYSAIFCDIKMPNMDGIEVLDRLNAEGVDAAVQHGVQVLARAGVDAPVRQDPQHGALDPL